MFKENYFQDYFNLEKLKDKNCIRNDRDKKNVYMEEIDGKIYYIKKYKAYGRRKRNMAFGLKRDPALYYKDISEIFKKIGIPHAEPLVVLVNRTSFFERESLYVTKKAGFHLEEYGYSDRLIQTFFDYFIIILKNKIYPTDYNTDGALVNSDGKLVLIDFDAYRQKIFLTKKYKKYVFLKLKKNFYIDFEKDISIELREKFKKYKNIINTNTELVRKELSIKK